MWAGLAAVLYLAFVLVRASSAEGGGWDRRQNAVPVRLPKSALGAVSGVVMDADTGTPIAGAILHLRGQANQVGQVTDAKGRFLFEDLPPYDQYDLTAVKAGYFDLVYGGASTGVGNSRFPPIVVAAGEWVRDIRVGLRRPAAISGRTLDDRGAPIVGAYVRVLRDVIIAGHHQLIAGSLTRTDDRGAFRIARLPPGAYYIQMPSVQEAVPTGSTNAELFGPSVNSTAADSGQGRGGRMNLSLAQVDALNQVVVGRYPTAPRAADGRFQVYPMTFFPNGSTVATAALVMVGAGEERGGIDLRISPVTGARLSGVLVGPPESLAGTTVRLLTPGAEALGAGGEVATALVDASGHFTLVNVPVGAYALDARSATTAYVMSRAVQELPAHPGGGRRLDLLVSSGPDGTLMRSNTAGRFGYSGHESVQVSGSDDITNLVVAMHKGVTLSGRLIWEGTRPSTPPGLSVLQAEPAQGEPFLGVLDSRTVETAADGFTIEGLLPGNYVLAASPVLARMGLSIKAAACGSRDYTRRPIDASLVGDVLDCTVTLTDKGATLVGRAVRDPDAGITARDLVVLVFPAEREQWRAIGLSPDRFRSAPITNDGRFRLTNLPAGDYFVIGVADQPAGAWMEEGVLEKAALRAARTRLEWSRTSVQDVTIVSWRQR